MTAREAFGMREERLVEHLLADGVDRGAWPVCTAAGVM
jgi:hypothetical protein